MAKFQWEATTRAGETRKGAMEAETNEVVDSRLRADGLTPRRIKKQAREIMEDVDSEDVPKMPGRRRIGAVE